MHYHDLERFAAKIHPVVDKKHPKKFICIL